MPKFSEIFSQSIVGIEQQFIGFFPDKKTEIVRITNNSHMRAILRKYKEIVFPYFALQIQNVSVKRDGLAPKTFQKQGVLAGFNTAKDSRVKYHLTPVDVQFRVVFATQSAIELYEFVQQWTTSCMLSDMDFNLTGANGDLDIIIKSHLDENLVIPEIDDDPNNEIGEIYLLETSITIDTYIGVAKQYSAIRTINLNLTDISSNLILQTFTTDAYNQNEDPGVIP